jgi:hypothetical protein
MKNVQSMILKKKVLLSINGLVMRIGERFLSYARRGRGELTDI